MSEWFFNKSNDMVRGYYPSIESSIFKNNTTRVSEDLTDEKFLFFNTWLNSDKDGNRLVKLQQEENIFGSDNVVGIYDKLVRKGVPPNLSKEQFNTYFEEEQKALAEINVVTNKLKKIYTESLYNFDSLEFKMQGILNQIYALQNSHADPANK